MSSSNPEMTENNNILPHFGQAKHPKIEYPRFKNAVEASAALHNIQGYVLSNAEHMARFGHIFIPAVAPVVPAANATALAYQRYNVLLAAHKEETRPLKLLTQEYVNAIGPNNVKLVGDPVHGIINRTLQQMVQTMDDRYLHWLPAEISGLKRKVQSGDIKMMNPDDLEQYIAELNIHFAILDNNQNGLSDIDKIQIVTTELRRLNVEPLNHWLKNYEQAHATIAAQIYAVFATDVQAAYANMNRITMEQAGYSAAQAKEVSEMSTQLREMREQLKQLQQANAANEKNNKRKGKTQAQPQQSEDKRKRSKGHNENKIDHKALKFGDTCSFNYSHWSSECWNPKEGHNASRVI